MTENYQVPDKMRALVLDGIGFDHLGIRKIPTPRPGPRQMLARVDAAGICTSLIKLVEQGPDHKLVYGWDVTRYPLVLGDEGSVTIVQVGRELKSTYRPGERYVLQPAVDHAPVNHRERYQNGAKGVEKVALGYTLAGHLAEYVLVTEEVIEAGCVLPLPKPDIPFAHAAASEPLSCCISAQDHHVHLTQAHPRAERSTTKGLRPGGVTVIIGAGAMGRMHVDLAFSYRPRAIVVADLIDSRLERVRTLFGDRAAGLGVELCAINTGEQDLQTVVAQMTSHSGADDVIVAVGSARAIGAGLQCAARGAVLNLFGGLKKGEETVGLDTGIIHYKEINVTGSSGGSPWDIARTLELMADGSLDPAVHITRIGDLDHAAEFLAMVKTQQIDGKAIVYPQRRTSRILAVERWTAADEQAYLEVSRS